VNTPFNLMRGFVCLAILATVAGCSSPPTRYFGTQPVMPGGSSSAGYQGPPVQIRTVNVPPQLDRAELMREVSPGEFEVREFDHWTAPLGQLMRQTLTEDLAARLPAGAVIYPDASRLDPVAYISINILSFRFQGDRAVMQVSWTVRSPTSVPALISDGQATLDVPGSDRSGADISTSLSATLAQLADRITTGLRAAAVATSKG
jgi:uncharacterized lipoprotein YmbA